MTLSSLNGEHRAASAPAIVLVPGSFSPPHFYEAVASALRNDHGFDTVTVIDMPSVGRHDSKKGRLTEPASMQDDAAEIRRVAGNFIDQGRDVVLIPHSYGGIPATEAVKGIASKDGLESVPGGKSGITTLVYVTSVVPRVGQSCLEVMGGVPDFLTMNDDYFSHDPVANGAMTFSDLPELKGFFWAKQMPEHSTQSFKDPLTYLGYTAVERVMYVICTKDKIIPPEFQKQMALQMEEDIAREDSERDKARRKVITRELDSAHCPNASQPKELAALLHDMIAGS